MNIWVVPPVRAVNGPLRPAAVRASAWAVQCLTAVPGFDALLALRSCPACWTRHVAANVDCVGSKRNGELEGQSSINELLDQPIGDMPIQLPLPFYLQVRQGEFQRAS